MRKLHYFKLDEDEWEFQDSPTDGQSLLNKYTHHVYDFCRRNIVGLHQTSEYTFLICTAGRFSKKQITVFELDAHSISKKILFIENFSEEVFLTEDTILLDAKAVYSISKNHRIENFNWLKQKKLTPLYFNSKDGDGDTYPYAILVSQIITSINPRSYVQVLVDPVTFKPISPATSTLREKKDIILSDEYTFNNLVDEDLAYGQHITSSLTDMSKNIHKEYTEYLLNYLKKN